MPFVRNKAELLILHRKAKAYGQRPAELLGLADVPVLAWGLDNACLLWGEAVEAMLQETEKIRGGKKGETRPKYTIEQLLDLPRPDGQRQTRAKGYQPLPASIPREE